LLEQNNPGNDTDRRREVVYILTSWSTRYARSLLKLDLLEDVILRACRGLWVSCFLLVLLPMGVIRLAGVAASWAGGDSLAMSVSMLVYS
jgi:hypothetical protein